MAQARSAARPDVRPVGLLAGLVQTAHPGPGLAVTLLAAAYAASLGLEPARLVLVVLAVWTGQLGIGWSNDLVDLGRDRTVGRSDKPLATGAVAVTTVRTACALAVGATVVLSLACGLVAGLVHLTCVAAAWAYNLGVKATPLSWLPYAAAFGGLPVFVSLAGPGDVPPLAVPVAAALLGVGAHLLNVVPDLVDDEATGVRGLGHRLGARRSTLLAVAALAGATVVVVLGSEAVPGVLLLAAGVAVAALASVAVLTHGRTPFRAAIGIAAVDVLLLVVAS